jgi:DNA-binding NarL/FixJ family response regulator
MEAQRREALLGRLEQHYARFERDARNVNLDSARLFSAPLVEPHDTPRTRSLSAREFSVLELLGEGLTDCEIAARLSIGDQTVKSHLRRIFAKLDARNRTHAVTRAIRLGLLDITPEYPLAA